MRREPAPTEGSGRIRVRRGMAPLPAILLGAIALAATPAGCAARSGPGRAEAAASPEWASAALSSGGRVNLLVLRPTAPARGLVVAFPWGAGDAGLLAGLIDTYWDEAAPAAGFAVIGVEVRGPSLAEGAEILMRAVLDWADRNLPGTSGSLILTGASAGGVGVFHAAVASPRPVDAVLAMPGRAGPEVALDRLAGVPVRLMVGEHDGRWVRSSRETAARLEAAGALVTLDVVAGQAHVLRVPQEELLGWIELHRAPAHGAPLSYGAPDSSPAPSGTSDRRRRMERRTPVRHGEIGSTGAQGVPLWRTPTGRTGALHTGTLPAALPD